MSQDETDFLVTMVAFGTITKACDYQRRWNSDVMMAGRVKTKSLGENLSRCLLWSSNSYQVRPE
jgi:hypothetical protein